MHAYAEKTQETKNPAVVNEVPQMDIHRESVFQFEDNRPETTAFQKMQGVANSSPQVSQLRAVQDMANNSPRAKQVAQLQVMADHYAAHQQPIQKKQNKTGLPDSLKTGIENLSGYSMDDVKVHRNSDKPAQLNAHAYAQGTDIHLASGQEKHLPHEAWHVVQQKQGRVKPTMQMKGKVNVNDDEGLEKEADDMGSKAIAAGQNGTVGPVVNTWSNSQNETQPMQLKEETKVVTGVTHLVAEQGGSLYKKKWWLNEGDQVNDGTKVIIETNDQLLSRRGPNQERSIVSDDYNDEHGDQQYLWFRVNSVEGEPPSKPKSYIREDTFKNLEEQFSSVTMWNSEDTETDLTTSEIMESLYVTHGINVAAFPPSKLLPFLKQHGGVYGSSATDIDRLIEDYQEHWANPKMVRFQAYYADSKIFRPGHLLMFDYQDGTMYQFKGAPQLYPMTDSAPSLAPPRTQPRRGMTSTEKSKTSIRDIIDQYIGEPEEEGGVDLRRPEEVTFNHVETGRDTTATSQPIGLWASSAQDAEEYEQARTTKSGKFKLHYSVLNADVEMSEKEYQELKRMMTVRSVLGFYNYCQEAQSIDVGATRCLSLVEDLAKMRGRVLKPGRADEVLKEFLDYCHISDNVNDIKIT